MRLMSIILPVLILSGAVGCASGSAEAKITLMERDWHRERKAIVVEGKLGKDRWMKEQELTRDLLKRYFTPDQRKSLPSTFHEWPVDKFQRTEFQNSVIRAALWQAVDDRQRQTVLRILAETPPDMFRTLEATLVRGAASAFPDPILIICDGYDISTRPEAKNFLEARLRAAFFGLVDEQDPDVFVRCCRIWYLGHRVECVVNPDYPRGFPEKEPLFIKRSAA